MAYVVARQAPEQGPGTAGRGHVDGLASPWSIGDHVPGALQEDDFCQRMVSGLDEVMAPIFASLDCFDAYLDPALAPEDFVDWLASWVGIEIDETWTLERRRRLIRDAVSLYRMRGTAAGLVAHVRLYSGATPELEESGGCAWSQTADNPIPGQASPFLRVRLDVDDDRGLRPTTLSRIVAASRPAHIPFSAEIVVRGSAVETQVDEAGGEAAADAPGAVDLPGSEHIELAPQTPPSPEEIDLDLVEPSDGTDTGD